MQVQPEHGRRPRQNERAHDRSTRCASNDAGLAKLDEARQGRARHPPRRLPRHGRSLLSADQATTRWCGPSTTHPYARGLRLDEDVKPEDGYYQPARADTTRRPSSRSSGATLKTFDCIAGEGDPPARSRGRVSSSPATALQNWYEADRFFNFPRRRSFMTPLRLPEAVQRSDPGWLKSGEAEDRGGEVDPRSSSSSTSSPAHGGKVIGGPPRVTRSGGGIPARAPRAATRAPNQSSSSTPSPSAIRVDVGEVGDDLDDLKDVEVREARGAETPNVGFPHPARRERQLLAEAQHRDLAFAEAEVFVAVVEAGEQRIAPVVVGKESPADRGDDGTFSSGSRSSRLTVNAMSSRSLRGRESVSAIAAL